MEPLAVLPAADRRASQVSQLREQVVTLVKERGYERREEPFRLVSGQLSHDYIDGKRAISSGDGLRLVAEAIVELAADEGVDFDAVGGLTMGADPLAHAVAVLTGKAWFSVRKSAKQHGKQKLIEGCELTPDTAVLVLDDVVTTGGSIEQALDAIDELQARVVLAVTLVDRADVAARRMSERGIVYRPLATYRDLDIDPVGQPSADR
jgi:orotate phosphoribosyltransferase